MLKKKTQHFSCCVRSSRVSIGAHGASPRPCVPSSVDAPVLEDVASTGVAMDGASVGVTSSHLPAIYGSLRAPCFGGLRNNLSAVVWVHCTVAVAVKNNGRDFWPVG